MYECAILPKLAQLARTVRALIDILLDYAVDVAARA